jgi:thiopeptide-type bacteriocin biosynthesis protein
VTPGPPTVEFAFDAGPFFAVRTPLLPFDELRDWGRGLRAKDASAREDAAHEAAWAADSAELVRRLRALVARPEVREAIFLAAPSLSDQAAAWLAQPEGPSEPKLVRALVRYFARMAGRPTPFGLFAGGSVGTVAPGAPTRIVLDRRAANRRRTRLDMDYLFTLADALGRDPAVRPGLTYRPNSSLYRAAGRLRYIASRRTETGNRHYVVGVGDSDALRRVLEAAESGATLPDLVRVLLELDPEATPQEADEFLAELVDQQLLVDDLDPPITGPEALDALCERLAPGTGTPPALAAAGERLASVRAALAQFDGEGLGVEPARYQAVAEELRTLPAPVELARLFQVDLVKSARAAMLGEPVLADLVRGVDLLHRLGRRRDGGALERFRQQFLERYESREVALTEALDDEMGVGYHRRSRPGTALLDGLGMPEEPRPQESLGEPDRHVLRLVAAAAAEGRQAIDLSPSDLDRLAEKDPRPLPDAFALIAAVAGAPAGDAEDAGAPRVVLLGLSGPSGAVLLGRFCHADRALRAAVEDHLRAEEAAHPDAVFAEIVHVPEHERLGNILSRPVLRTFEIAFHGRSGAALNRQIPLADLRVSVAGGEVRLRSARLGKRVLPRLTSAHNYAMQGHDVYRFLCDLQTQGSAVAPGWDWGPLRGLPALPRVTCGRLVLARACWQADSAELRELARPTGPRRFRQVQEWRHRRGLPRWIELAEGDQLLPVDLDNPLLVDTFVELVKGRDGAVLVEMFPSPDELWVSGPEGAFVHELVVPFVRRRAPAPAPAPAEPAAARGPAPRTAAPARRRFPPGSEWLFAKLYTGFALSDELLLTAVGPVVRAALASGACDGWFFIRYTDPHPHVRVRWHGEPARLRDEVWPALERSVSPWLEDGRVWRLQLDTYEREVERYGGDAGVRLAERLFDADSTAAMAMLSMLTEDAAGAVRWRVALLSVARLLADLKIPPRLARTAVAGWRDALAREDPNATGWPTRTQLGEIARHQRRAIDGLLDPVQLASDPIMGRAVAILDERSAVLAAWEAELSAMERTGALERPRIDLVWSYAHMAVNRLLLSDHRAQEMILYDLLDRAYAAASAMGRGRPFCGGEHETQGGQAD